MKEFLYDYFASSVGNLSTQTIIMNFLVAFVLGMLIYVSYRFSHSGAIYSARFNVSLVKLTLITTLVMNVIGNNIALSLGMVGALSIVRFRTAIKDPRDTTYIFWCIAVGICCGVSDYIVAIIGTGIIFLFMLVFGSIKANDRYLLVINADNESQHKIEQCVLTTYAGKATMRVKNTTRDSAEYIYELSSNMMKRAEQENIDIIGKLYDIEGVRSVNEICQNEEINR